jgi:hypothetical protein
MEEYISDSQLQTLLEDMQDKLENDQIKECRDMLIQILEDAENQEKYIDRTYLGNVKEKKRRTRIEEITAMLEKMSDKQVENVHSYTVDEYDEPNHAEEALKAIMKLSHKA